MVHTYTRTNDNQSFSIVPYWTMHHDLDARYIRPNQQPDEKQKNAELASCSLAVITSLLFLIRKFLILPGFLGNV